MCLRFLIFVKATDQYQSRVNGRRLTALRIGKRGCLCILGAKAIAGMAGVGCCARTRQENNYAPSAP